MFKIQVNNYWSKFSLQHRAWVHKLIGQNKAFNTEIIPCMCIYVQKVLCFFSQHRKYFGCRLLDVSTNVVKKSIKLGCWIIKYITSFISFIENIPES